METGGTTQTCQNGPFGKQREDDVTLARNSRIHCVSADIRSRPSCLDGEQLSNNVHTCSWGSFAHLALSDCCHRGHGGGPHMEGSVASSTSCTGSMVVVPQRYGFLFCLLVEMVL